MAVYKSDPSSPTGFRRVDSGSRAIVTPSAADGTYKDAQGRTITKQEAMSTGRIDAPGATASALQRIGGTGSGVTTAVEQRLAREDIAKRQVQEGRFTAGEIQGARAILESQTAQFAGKTPEQQAALRQALYEQVVYREPRVRPATQYIPYQTNQKAVEDFKRSIGLGGPVTASQRALTQADKIQYTSEADIRYVTIGGKQRLFINPSLVRQRDPFGDLERKASESLKANIPVAVSDFVDMVDRRAQASFTGPKSKNPFALRNVAEKVFGIERGIVKGAVEKPLTTGGSLALGFGVTKLAGAAAKGLPILTKGIGAGKVTSQISALNVAGGAMAGYYGADVAARIAQANDRYEKLGEILGSELIPMALGARLATTKLPDVKPYMPGAKRARLIESYKEGSIASLPGKIRNNVPTKDFMNVLSKQSNVRQEPLRFYSKQQLQAIKRVQKESIVEKEYKPNISDYAEDIRAELKRLEGHTPSFKQSRVIKNIGAWDFKLNKFVRTAEAEARASKVKSSSDIFNIMERRNLLKEKLKILESTEYNMPTVRKEQPDFIRKHSKIIDLSKSQHTEKTNALASILAGHKTRRIGLVQRTQTVQIQREKPILAPRPKFGLEEGYHTTLNQLKAASKTQQSQVNAILQSLGAGVAQTQGYALKTRQTQGLSQAQIQHQQFIQKIIQAQQQLQGMTQTQLQVQSQLQGQSQIQGVLQKQTTLQRQIQQQKQRIRYEPPREPARRQPPEKRIILKIPSFKSQLANVAKARKKKGKYIWDIKNPVPTLESLV